MKETRINWSGFMKLRSEQDNTIKAAMCLECGKLLKTISDIRFNIHRNCCKGEGIVVDEAEDGENVNPPKRTRVGNNEMGGDRSNSDLGNEEDISELNTRLDKALAMFFFSCSIAFRIVENPYFRTFVKLLGKAKFDYQIPCRQTLADSILKKVHKDIVEEKKKMLDNTESVLLVDGWRNKSVNRKFLVFTLRTTNIFQTFLTFKDSSIETEDGYNLSENINEAINFAKEQYNTNVVSIITDNDNKIVCGGRMAETNDGQNLLQSTCSSHSANLLIKSVVSDDLQQIVRDVVHAFHDPKMESLLLMLGGTKLKNYPDTRFCYFRDSCKSIHKNFQVLRRVCCLEDVSIDERILEYILDSDLEARLDVTIRNLDPICKLINKCQDPKMNVADATQMWLSLVLPTNEYDDVIEARLVRALKPLSYAANLLHHRYKGLLLDFDKKNRAIDFLKENLDAEGEEDLDQYLAWNDTFERFSICCESVISFWELCRIRSPKLAQLAITLMTIPASTALIESLFSQWTYVQNIYRNRLGNVKSGMLIDIYHSLKFMKLYMNDLLMNEE